MHNGGNVYIFLHAQFKNTQAPTTPNAAEQTDKLNQPN